MSVCIWESKAKLNKAVLFVKTIYFPEVRKHMSQCFLISDFFPFNSEPYFFLSNLVVQLQEQNEKSLSLLQ